MPSNKKLGENVKLTNALAESTSFLPVDEFPNAALIQD